jgi:hypothetical protein
MIENKIEANWIHSRGRSSDDIRFDLKVYALSCSRSQEFNYRNIINTAWSLLNQAVFYLLGYRNFGISNEGAQ